jgi:hypothetical protein
MRITYKRLSMAVVAAAALTTAGIAGSAAATGTGSVQSTPATYTPSIATPSTDGTTEVVRKLVACGGNMYAVGKFTSIKQVNPAPSVTLTRNNVFSFSATTGTLTGFDPNVNGQVNGIALSTDCSIAYLGGSFTQVGATTVKNFAAVSTSTGAVIPTVASSVSGTIQTLQLTSTGHLIMGGSITGVNGTALDKYLVSVKPSTGKNDHYLHLGVSGTYSFTDQGGHSAVTNRTQVYNSQLSPDGTRMLAEGDFTTVGGQPRQQVVMLDLGPTSATLDPWFSTEFNAHCATVQPFYVRAASWSADGSKVYTATTGYKPATGTGYNTFEPRAGLCDALAQFPSTGTNVTHTWVNYTGCDSYYSTAEDGRTVYAAGHERWANNPNGCDGPGPGAVADSGLAGFDIPSGLVVTKDTDATVGKYQRAKGLGADDMLFTTQGLWIGSDNGTSSGTAQQCGGVSGHAGICLLPY